MKTVILTISNIPLSVKYRSNNSLPPSLRRFKNNSKEPTKQIWHLESLGIDKIKCSTNTTNIKKRIDLMKERFPSTNHSRYYWMEKQESLFYLQSQYPKDLESISFYFNNPIEINLKQRKIRHFYFKEDIVDGIQTFDSRLITFAYSQILALKEGMLLHCSCVVKNGEAYLFFAPSAGGKSTVARLSKQYSVLGDDIIAIRKIKGRLLAFSTPWRQNKFIKPRASLNAPIKAVFFLKKSTRLYFEPLRPEEALIRVLSRYIHFFLYTERPQVEKMFFTAANFFKAIPAYEMHFRKDENFWSMLEKIIR